jgi:hypothetical protein
MPQPQSPLSPVVQFATIGRPACPGCRAQMMVARIVTAFVGTHLYGFECTACNHVLKTHRAHDDRRCQVRPTIPYAAL